MRQLSSVAFAKRAGGKLLDVPFLIYSFSARRPIQDLFALWKDADPDVPILKEAQRITRSNSKPLAGGSCLPNSPDEGISVLKRRFCQRLLIQAFRIQKRAVESDKVLGTPGRKGLR